MSKNAYTEKAIKLCGTLDETIDFLVAMRSRERFSCATKLEIDELIKDLRNSKEVILGLQTNPISLRQAVFDLMKLTIKAWGFLKKKDQRL